MFTTLLPALCERYESALLQGDSAGAATVITDGLAQNVSILSLYLEVVLPVQVEIGERWHRGELNIAAEHLATQISLTQVARLRLSMPVAGHSNRHVVVGAVEHELHDLGARVIADLFLMDGWLVDFLGANTPTPDLVALVQARHPDLVLLSVTLPDHLASASQAVDALRLLSPRPKIIVGGRACRDSGYERLAADAFAEEAGATLQQAQALVPANESPQDLQHILLHLGQQIRQLRQARHWSQQQLGQAAGLDRSYINGVEQGKQNLTLGAVLKLADALETSLDDLLLVRLG